MYEQQLKTLANGKMKILMGEKHQFQLTIKILEKKKLITTDTNSKRKNSFWW